MEAWGRFLKQHGFSGCAERVRVVGVVLNENEFAGLCSFSMADDPIEWLGASRLRAEEVQFLRSLCKIADKAK